MSFNSKEIDMRNNRRTAQNNPDETWTHKNDKWKTNSTLSDKSRAEKAKPERSVREPQINSDSASGKSNGARPDAIPDPMNVQDPRRSGMDATGTREASEVKEGRAPCPPSVKHRRRAAASMRTSAMIAADSCRCTPRDTYGDGVRHTGRTTVAPAIDMAMNQRFMSMSKQPELFRQPDTTQEKRPHRHTKGSAITAETREKLEVLDPNLEYSLQPSARAWRKPLPPTVTGPCRYWTDARRTLSRRLNKPIPNIVSNKRNINKTDKYQALRATNTRDMI